MKFQQSWWLVAGMKGWAGSIALASHTFLFPWHTHLQHHSTAQLIQGDFISFPTIPGFRRGSARLVLYKHQLTAASINTINLKL